MDDEFDLHPPRCVSYLQARDPSIVSWNRHEFAKVRQNLADAFSSTIPSRSPEEQETGLSVHLRIKGCTEGNNLYTVENNTLICAIPEESYASRNDPRSEKTKVLKKYQFTNIFGPHTSQEKLFNSLIKDKILSFINGNNSTLLAYGVSGSGKTFTMVGTAEEPGIIPRSLDYLFRTISNNSSHEPTVKPLPNGTIEPLSELKISQEINNLRKILQDPQAFNERNQHEKMYNEMQRRLSGNQVGILETFPPIVSVWVSFAEIYNESIYDLLQPLPGRGQQRCKLILGGLQDGTYIRGQKYIHVRTGLEAYQVLQYGLHNLSYAATAVNQHSSRSHSIFSIRLVSGKNERQCNVTVFNFCDLAGSERHKKTMNEGDRLKESTKINTSLSVLGRCISNIRDIQKNVKDCCTAPFRESKLTQLFQKALQGKEDILMIVNINPSTDMFDETQHALIFAAVAKQIVIQKVPPKIPKPNRFSLFRQNRTLSEEEEEDERDNELIELRNERARLVLRISEMRETTDELIEAEKNHLRESFEKIIQLQDSMLSDLRKDVAELGLANERYKREIRQLHNEHAKRKQEEEQVIVLSSDEESEAEETESSADRDYFQKEIENLKQKHQQELDMQKEETLRVKTEMSKKISELEETLVDADIDYTDLLKEHNELRAQIEDLTTTKVTLDDQISVQNKELEGLRLRVVEQTEEIERLEVRNQDLLHSTKEDPSQCTIAQLEDSKKTEGSLTQKDLGNSSNMFAGTRTESYEDIDRTTVPPPTSTQSGGYNFATAQPI